MLTRKCRILVDEFARILHVTPIIIEMPPWDCAELRTFSSDATTVVVQSRRKPAAMSSRAARKRQQAEHIFNAIPRPTPSDDADPTKPDIKRVAVVDACNVLHSCAGLALNCGPSVDSTHRIPDAIGLLLVAQELLADGFEVRIVIPASYMDKAKPKVDNFFILEEMEQLRLLTVVPHWSHDDLRIIEMAASVGGFVVSNDKYYDHVIGGQLDGCALGVVRWRTLAYRLERVPAAAALRTAARSPQSVGSSSRGDRSADDSLDFMAEPSNWTLSTGVRFQFIGEDRRIMYARAGDDGYAAAALERSLLTGERVDECATGFRLLFEYIQQNFCAMLGVRPPKLPYFHPKFDELPLRFVGFKRLYKRHLESEAMWERINGLRRPASAGSAFVPFRRTSDSK